jgi:predicted RNase H-like nuclease
VAIVLENGGFKTVGVFKRFSNLLAEYQHVSVIAVDIPIGLPTKGVREADIEARSFLGPRWQSVFVTPPRRAIEAPSYEEAARICLEINGTGMSTQSYALRSRILDVDAHVRANDNIIEIHPEVSFCALSAGHLSFSKTNWNGFMHRKKLLDGAGIKLPGELAGKSGLVPPVDLLDAAAAAWSAVRKSNGFARTLPDPPSYDERGRPVAIWY